ncbi:SMC-Scp complex subunit ScpB [Rhodohalobacter barkolensis]|uniref:SMC-Scp complex subunit ScpB n=2 Tax=Rhodohalobacter barkolensis TaxID=2053187 RepID=A0A2N0VF08_9BACT|nr:SMC-Scp complex subunit ScpB [Rhodohalobacter barkolensis]
MMLDFRFVDGTRLTSVVEALIFASPDPIPWDKLSSIIHESEEEVEPDERVIERIVDQLNSRYEENDLSFRIEKTGGGYTFVTQPRFHPWLSIFQHENAYRKLSQSAIETLAIVAYRQPITKPEVDQIRGVDSGYILRQLLEKMLVKVSGRADSPGKPLLYKTTDYFLKHFGINSVTELPKPREIDEILKDDDMAEHRRLLMERQMEIDESDEADEILEEFLEKFNEDDESPNDNGGQTTDDQEGESDEVSGEQDEPKQGD